MLRLPDQTIPRRPQAAIPQRSQPGPRAQKVKQQHEHQQTPEEAEARAYLDETASKLLVPLVRELSIIRPNEAELPATLMRLLAEQCRMDAPLPTPSDAVGGSGGGGGGGVGQSDAKSPAPEPLSPQSPPAPMLARHLAPSPPSTSSVTPVPVAFERSGNGSATATAMATASITATTVSSPASDTAKNATGITVYAHPRHAPSRATLWVLQLLELPHNLRWVDDTDLLLPQQPHATSDRRLSGCVPAMIDESVLHAEFSRARAGSISKRDFGCVGSPAKRQRKSCEFKPFRSDGKNVRYSRVMSGAKSPHSPMSPVTPTANAGQASTPRVSFADSPGPGPGKGASYFPTVSPTRAVPALVHRAVTPPNDAHGAAVAPVAIATTLILTEPLAVLLHLCRYAATGVAAGFRQNRVPLLTPVGVGGPDQAALVVQTCQVALDTFHLAVSATNEPVFTMKGPWIVKGRGAAAAARRSHSQRGSTDSEEASARTPAAAAVAAGVHQGDDKGTSSSHRLLVSHPEKVHAAFAMLEAQLGRVGGAFLCGESPTLADVLMYTLLAYFELFPQHAFRAQLDKSPRLTQWLEAGPALRLSGPAGSLRWADFLTDIGGEMPPAWRSLWGSDPRQSLRGWNEDNSNGAQSRSNAAPPEQCPPLYATAEPVALYVDRLCPASRAVRWLAARLEVPHKLHWIDMAANEHLEPSFTALSPLAQVPLLTAHVHVEARAAETTGHDQGKPTPLCLWEPLAIMRWLCDVAGARGAALSPNESDITGAALCDNAFLVAQAGLQKVLASTPVPAYMAPASKVVGVHGPAAGLIEGPLLALELQLGRCGAGDGGVIYLAGGAALSFCDAYVYYALSISDVLPEPLLNAGRFPLLHAWRDRVRQHPGIADTDVEWLAHVQQVRSVLRSSGAQTQTQTRMNDE